MKKLFLIVAVMTLLAGQMNAGPVDVNTAKDLGAKYLKHNVSAAKNVENVNHVFTLDNEEGTPYLYIFNYDNGFVVVAADDRAHPVLGYSDEGAFDANNIPEGMMYYMNHFGRQIQYAIDNNLEAEAEITAQWDLLRREGVISHEKMDRAVSPLLSTVWNQDYPYNYYAPTSSSYWAPGGHCYAGCVATAMSQLMKYWNWPTTGVGEHTYSSSSHGGTLTANFGATTYNWAIMPNQLGYTANDAALAVALLMYHCGVAVDMDYAPDGSGAHTEDIPDAVIEHFRYGACTYVDMRDSYSRTAWEDMLISTFDRGIPVIYAGQDTDGGHAFNCDGYNDQRYFHFNWGWSGQYNNTYYQIDALNTGNGHFNSNQRVVFNMIPDYIYEAMVPAIETMEVEVADAMTKRVNISWTVPTESAAGTTLESIEQILLRRNGVLIETFNNPQPGEVMTFEETVADYGYYEYSISGVNNGIEGVEYAEYALFGPNCTWKLVCQTTNFQGWNGGKVQIASSNGTIFQEVTMTGSSPVSIKFQMPEGGFTMNWYAPSSEVSSMSISLKNSANQQVYNFSGSSAQLSGIIFTGDNDCEGCTPPTNLAGEYVYRDGVDGALLTWSCDYTPSNYKIYRSLDGEFYEEVAKIDNSTTEYFDPVGTAGQYFYKVTAFSNVCESTPAYTASNTDYVIVEVLAVMENTIDARLYPNPANSSINVEAAGIEEVTVCNALGQTVYRYNGSADALNINTSGFEAGIYMVNVKSHEGNAKVRIIIMH